MNRSTTITDPAADTDLVALDVLKADLGVIGSASDELLERLISRASSVVQDYIGHALAVEIIEDRFDADAHRAVEHPAGLILSRRPIVEIHSITDNGTALVEGTDFRVNAATGQVARIGTASRFTTPVVVSYSAGHPSIPPAVEDVVVGLVRSAYSTHGRDPALRSEEVAGIGSQTFFAAPATTALTAEAIDVLSRYRDFGGF
jgi:hypothetical protein